ncbi:hypothetical protein MLD38_011830 [Melastoma candidum]|uniref:Uncharacterized protein n=1 Tax=Melastoma candidum TaxID=119954 RepID=A0ACB9R7W0_9MYRT|nr:hypothetical protein MLD38_011830 [Melastoma candidum]
MGNGYALDIFSTSYLQVYGHVSESSRSISDLAMRGSTSLVSSGIRGGLPDNSVHDIHLANRPPPYNAEQRYSTLQRDGLEMEFRETAMG